MVAGARMSWTTRILWGVFLLPLAVGFGAAVWMFFSRPWREWLPTLVLMLWLLAGLLAVVRGTMGI